MNSLSLEAHLAWRAAQELHEGVMHPLAPIIHAWQNGPAAVKAVRTETGALRGDTILPRIAMRDERSEKADRLYLSPAHIGSDGNGGQMALPGFFPGCDRLRIPALPLDLYDLGVRAGERQGGRGGAPIPARLLVKLAAAPSTSARHSERFVTYDITLRDLRDALWPAERLDGNRREQRGTGYVWPHVRNAVRLINTKASMPVLDPATGFGRYHQLIRINENFGKITLDMPIDVVLDIPEAIQGGVALPKRLDMWGAESAPAYRALIGLSFLWHEPGRTHAPKGGVWLRKTGVDPYVPLTDADAVALAYPSSITTNRRQLARRAWSTFESLGEHGELRIDGRRLLPPVSM